MPTCDIENPEEMGRRFRREALAREADTRRREAEAAALDQRAAGLLIEIDNLHEIMARKIDALKDTFTRKQAVAS